MNNKPPHDNGQPLDAARWPDQPGAHVVTTRDHAAIQQWALAHGAEPATGESTSSGAAHITVNDGGVGIRFNFPGFAPFRPIAWEEWLQHFDAHELAFVFEERDDAQVAVRAHEISESHGGAAGHERADWFEAERDLRLQGGGGSPSVRYRFTRTARRS